MMDEENKFDWVLNILSYKVNCLVDKKKAFKDSIFQFSTKRFMKPNGIKIVNLKNVHPSQRC